ncbi:MAG: hypothetical protein J6W84_03345 [Bacteroidales bacterium]|nr:hypothetical protein [Bacteroidales bacterium]
MGNKADPGAYVRNMKFLKELREQYLQGLISCEEMSEFREMALAGNPDEAQMELAKLLAERKNL